MTEDASLRNVAFILLLECAAKAPENHREILASEVKKLYWRALP